MGRQTPVHRQFVALALAIAVSAIAMADSAETVSSRIVRIADLDLRSREGAEAVYQRIVHAADAMCSLSWGMRTLGGSATLAAQVRECKAEAIERAVTQVHAPMVTAVFRSRTAKST